MSTQTTISINLTLECQLENEKKKVVKNLIKALRRGKFVSINGLITQVELPQNGDILLDMYLKSITQD